MNYTDVRILKDVYTGRRYYENENTLQSLYPNLIFILKPFLETGLT
jgi:hypothetical protein